MVSGGGTHFSIDLSQLGFLRVYFIINRLIWVCRGSCKSPGFSFLCLFHFAVYGVLDSRGNTLVDISLSY